MKIHLVGGAVRDALLGLSKSDRDWVVTGATPAQMQALGYRPVGKDFPVFLHPQSKEEYALARTERKSGHGYKGFVFNADPGVTLEEDLQRRDLTINAIARTEDGQIIDPWGGVRDLEERVLRHVSPAFAEDPLRVLRVARFAARFAPLGFRVAPETLALMRQLSSSGELQHLVAERVWQEMEKALSEPAPAEFFRVLRECGALQVILPEVDALFGVPQPALHHPEIDTGVHVLMCLEQAARLSNDPVVRFATLVHDLGKGTTPAANWPSHHGHEERGVALIAALSERLRVPTRFAAMGRLVSQYHTHCHRAAQLRADTMLKLLEALDAFRRPLQLTQFLLACEADARGRTGFEERPYPQADRVRSAFAAASAIDIPALLAGSEGIPVSDPTTIKRRIASARTEAIARTGAIDA
jgi:tRNA nucleotidyltransferase (CCA-adding enzyme)